METLDEESTPCDHPALMILKDGESKDPVWFVQ